MVPTMHEENDTGMAQGAVFLPHGYGEPYKRFKTFTAVTSVALRRQKDGGPRVKRGHESFDDFLI